MTTFSAAVIIGVSALVAFGLTGCSAEGEVLVSCRDAVAQHYGVDRDVVVVTETIETPAGAVDWRGEVAGDRFACASPDGDELTSVVVFGDTGNAVGLDITPR